MSCKHFWMEIESDNLGKPTKYKCLLCPMEYSVKPKVVNYVSDYFDKTNQIKNKIRENNQKIEFLRLESEGNFTKIHIEHLEKEIITLNKLLNGFVPK